MPYRGWKTVAIREETYQKLRERAVQEVRSVANLADKLIREGLDDA